MFSPDHAIVLCTRVEVNRVLETKAVRTACLLAKQKENLPWCTPWMESLTSLTSIASSWTSLFQHLASEEAGGAGLPDLLPKQRGHKLSLAYRGGEEHPNTAGHGNVCPSRGGCSG